VAGWTSTQSDERMKGMGGAPRLGLFAAAAVVLCVSTTAWADVIDADPSNYKMLLPQLEPGDTLSLAPGTYTRLTLQGLAGTAEAPIVITGPEAGEPAIVVGESGFNTVQLYGCAHVVVRNLVVDVQGLAVDAINAKDSISHDITIEHNLLRGFPGDNQQIVGINTKSTAFNWVVRGNVILEPGTGLYLGNSNGEAQFVAGIIEHNLVLNPLGYGMQIKHQNAYTPVEGMPSGPSVTFIRHNVFIKDDRPSPSGDRPNLLVSGFPDSGPGSEDRYEIYGNFLFYNPRESLFQGSGRMSIHDNIFAAAGAGQSAINITPHEGKNVQIAHVYNNTILGGARGIRLGAGATESDAAVGNLILADTPISGSFSDERDNIVDLVANAGSYVADPALELGVLDLYPLPDAVEGDPIDLSGFAGDTDYDRDYNGASKGAFAFRGAYAGAGENPGCPLTAEAKIDCGVDDGSDDGGTADDGGGDDDDGGGDAGDSDGDDAPQTSASASSDGGDETSSGDQNEGESSGCGCASARPTRAWLCFTLLLLFSVRRRLAR
jgi:hypothetical protein